MSLAPLEHFAPVYYFQVLQLHFEWFTPVSQLVQAC